MIQLLSASTLFQVASLAAMADAGVLPAIDGERVLLLAHGTQLPELTAPIQDAAGFASLATRFDRVVDLADLLWPRRPAQFNPRPEELPLFERLLRSHWGLGSERVQLVVESIQVNPNQALCRIFHDAPILVHSDGLMSYGPTRNTLPTPLRQRLDAVLYVDLVPGLRPVLLREERPVLVPAPAAALATVFSELAAAAPDAAVPSAPKFAAAPDAPAPSAAKFAAAPSAPKFAAAPPAPDANAAPSVPAGPANRPATTALLLGQYLASLRLIDAEEEAELHHDMLREAHRRGATDVVFKLHPSAGPAAATRLARQAGALGLGFRLLEAPILAETACLLLRPDVVVGCFSTALVSIRYLFGIECAAVGTELMLERLAPYENSNRIPVTLIDALLVRGLPAPAEDPRGHDGTLQRLVNAVSYCMQSDRLPDARDDAQSFLAAGHPAHARYFKRRRLTRLGLPGGLPPRPAPVRFAQRLRGSVRRRSRHAAGSTWRIGRNRWGAASDRGMGKQ